MKVVELVQQTIDKYHMFSPGDKVVVGVSGGADSVCLLHVLDKLKKRYNLQLFVVHINHQLRGQAAIDDAQYVEQLCNTFNIPVFIKNANVKKIVVEQKISEELAGRQARYSFFFEVLSKIDGDKIAIAQNMNDQAETLLMRFIRGTGLEGLTAIKPVREDHVVRPLLEVQRKYIERYCEENHLEPRIDHTNLELIYTRNKIRHQLIPHILKEYNENFIDTAANMVEMLREENDFINQTIEDIGKKEIKKDEQGVWISIPFFLNQHIAIQRRIIRKAIFVLQGNIIDIGYKHIEDIIEMTVRQSTGKSLNLPERLNVEVIYDRLYFYHRPIITQDKELLVPLSLNGETILHKRGVRVITRIADVGEFNKKDLNQYKQVFDYDLIKDPIYIRNRLQGDQFIPLGMKGKKKIKDFFMDLKIPKHKRNQIFIIATKDDILWVVGYRISQKFKCTSKTKKVLFVEILGGITND